MLRLLPLLAMLLPACTQLPPASPRPNIILILADDQGYGDFSATGNPVLRTPHIDSLGREGATFRRFYVNPVCSPTRASLLTGRYSHRTGVVDTWRGRSMMAPEEMTLAEALQAQGYRTGIFGKWHLGDCYPMRPQDQGFDEVLVHRGGGLAQPSEPVANRRRYTDPILLHNGKEITTQGYCTDVYFRAALAHIRRARSLGQPFFCYIAPNAPHGPFHDVPEASYARFRDADLSGVLQGRDRDRDRVARIFAMVDNIDQNLGRLLTAVDQLGLRDNTLILYLTDNGPAGRRFVGPMRGRKSQVHEGGIRSPGFLRWPAQVPQGTEIDQPVAHIDVFPSFCAAAGLTPPAGIDGRDFGPLLRAPRQPLAERLLHIQSHRGDAPQREHNFAVIGPRYKLCRPSGFGHETPREDTPLELYDLAADPFEQDNLAARKPAIRDRLLEAHRRWFAEVWPAPGMLRVPRIQIGTLAEPNTLLSMQDWRAQGPGWGRQGEWQLHAAAAQRYDLLLHFAKATDLDALHLTIRHPTQAGQRRLEPSRLNPHSYLVADQPLPAGDFQLQLTPSHRGKALRPYQVELRRR